VTRGSIQGVGSVVAPLLGTTLLTAAGWAPGVFAGGVALALVPYVNAKFARGGETVETATAASQPAETR